MQEQVAILQVHHSSKYGVLTKMAWGKAGSKTLDSTDDAISVTSMSANDTFQYMSHIITSSTFGVYDRYNDVSSGNLYHGRYETNGKADQPFQANQIYSMLDNSGGTSMSAGDYFNVSYMLNLPTEEKMTIGFSNMAQATGTGSYTTSPKRNWYVGKFDNSDQITSVSNTNISAGDYLTDSNLTVLGSDLTPASAIVFPTNVQIGSRAEITDTRKIYFRIDSDYVTDKWFQVGTLPYAGGRAVFGGGYNTSSSAEATIGYVTIATLGNASDFGDLTQARYGLGAMANKTRALFAGGTTGGGNQTTIDFITPATLGDAATFGSISNDTAKTYGVMCLSSETRGIIAGGESGYSNRIDYVTIATAGNSTTFGATLTVAGKQGATTSDGSRGVFMGGEGRTPTMDYITIGTTGTCTDFGDLRTTLNGGSHGLATDGTIGVFTTGQSYEANIEKITIQTLGNSTNFGDMSTGRSNLGLASDKTRAIFAGGKTASGTNYTNIIEYSSMPLPSGNAADFGDLQVARQVLAGASDTGADRS